MSANIEILRALGEAERTVLHNAEPFSAFAAMLGAAPWPGEALDLAWQHLFRVHAHDSVHGLGVPKIKRDSLHRLDQAREIASVLGRRAVEGLVAQIDTSGAEEDDIFVTVFNPTQTERDEVVELQIDLPREEYVTDWWLETLDGTRVDHFVRRKETTAMAMMTPESRPKPIDIDRSVADVAPGPIPAFGYRTLRLRREKGDAPPGPEIFSSGEFAAHPIAPTPRVLDNGLLRVEANADGTIDLIEKESGARYAGLLELIDTGERGDCWVHHEPDRDRVLSSIGAPVRIETTDNSFLRAALAVTVTMEIPASLTADREARSRDTVPLEVTHEIALSRGARRVEVVTRFENRAHDHFLRVALPTGLSTETALCDAPFHVCERSFRTTPEHGLRGPELARECMTSWCAARAGGRGLAVFSRTVKEFGLDVVDEGAVLLLSLLRAVEGRFPVDEHLFIDENDPFGQCLGPQRFEYALAPFRTEAEEALPVAAQAYLHPLVAAEFGRGAGGSLPTAGASFLAFPPEGRLLFCGMKRAEEGEAWILRLYNPTDRKVEETIRPFRRPTAARSLRLDEAEGEPLAVEADGGVRVTAGPHAIVTVEFALS